MLQTGSQTASGRLCPAPHQPLPSSVCPATGGSEQADVGGAGAHTSEGWAGSRVPAVLKSPVGRAHLLPRGGASPGRPSVWVSLQLPSVGASTCRPPCGQQRGQHSFEKPTVGLCEGQPVAPPGVLGRACSRSHTCADRAQLGAGVGRGPPVPSVPTFPVHYVVTLH